MQRRGEQSWWGRNPYPNELAYWKVILFFWIFGTGPLISQPASRSYEWEYFGPERGMGMSFNKILQDHQGFLWFGSTNGLYRYDGYQLTFFKKYSPGAWSLSSDWIWDLAEDERGDLWIATYSGGLNRRERATGRITHFRHRPGDPSSLSGDMVLHLLFDREGRLWMVVQPAAGPPVLNRLDPSTGTVTRFTHDARGRPFSPAVAGQPGVNLHPLALDADGALWVGAETGLYRFQPESGGFVSVPLNIEPAYPRVINIYSSPHDNRTLWIATADAGLSGGAVERLDRTSRRAVRVYHSPPSADDGPPLSLWQPARRPDQLWFSSRRLHTLHLYSGRTESFYPELHRPWPVASDEPAPRFCFSAADAGLLTLYPLGLNPTRQIRGADNYTSVTGIQFFDSESRQSRHFDRNPADTTRPFESVRSVTADRSGNLWVGTITGFFKLKRPDYRQRNHPAFTNYFLPPADPNNGRSSNLRAVFEESDDLFWLGAFNGGLHRLDRRSGRLLTFTRQEGRPQSLRHDNVYALYADSRRQWLWVGHQKGIDRFRLDSLDGESPSPVFIPLRDEGGRLDTRVNAIVPAGDGRLWIGTGDQGLLLIEESSGRILRQYLPRPDEPGTLPYPFVGQVFTDSRGQTWVSSGMGGACRLQGAPDSASFRCFLEGLFIADYHEAADGRLWMAAMNYGLALFDRDRETYELLTMDNRLLRNTATGIAADRRGRIWFTSLGLGRYDPEKDTYRFFGRADGILDLDPERCFFRNRRGELFYGGANGTIQIFDPDAVVDDPATPPVVLTAFYLFNELQQPGKGSPLAEQIEVAREIRLNHDQHSFSLEFAGLEFTEPDKNQYKFKLEGIDPDWVYTGAIRQARYNNVPPGRYTFLVDAANGDGIWSGRPARLPIIVARPWWAAPWAVALWTLGAAGLMYLAFRLQRRRLRLQARLALELQEAERLKELDALKNRLFTNITHEFRTPLTLIQGMAEQILSYHHRRRPDKLEEAVDKIQVNSDRLLVLVNRMLDLARLEAGAMPLHLEQGDIVSLLKYLLDSFESRARQLKIDLEFQSERPELIMDHDVEKMQQIISNLLSNALKFTPAGGTVMMNVSCPKDSSDILISITDTGIGIPAAEIPLIFDRFYRVPLLAPPSGGDGAGSGIGLALTRELVRLLDGEITVESSPGRGSTFQIRLPLTRQAPVRESVPEVPVAGRSDESLNTPSSAPEPAHFPKNNPNLPLVLLVEDNADVLNYLEECLSGRYRVLRARDGIQGRELARQQTPDLVISDVMMPGLDGYELCRSLKSRPETSHVPVVLLTALSAPQDRLAGLEGGADAYLTKPFRRAELMAVIRNLIEQRDCLRLRYARGAPAPEAPPDPEDAFIALARQAVEARLDDSDLSVEDLAAALSMGRTQLYRKLNYLTGSPPVAFIRTIRLQHALSLLKKNPDLNISDIAYRSGFSDPGYFTKVFTKEFGFPPTKAR